ncbi:hypothetical protein ACVWZR_007709 [Bradyrhizobium sp. i1.3.1]
MSTDHDIMRLPDPPPPAPDARASAVQQALLRFDQKSAEEKNADDSQGVPTDIRLIERTAASLRPSRERTVMNRTRYLLAASLACIVAGSGAYLHLMWSPQPQDAGVRVERLASNAVAQAPSTVEAKKESESHAQPQMQIQTASQAGKPSQEGAAPSAAAAPPPARSRVENLIASRDAPKAPPATALRAPMQGAPSEMYALRGRNDHMLSRAPSAQLLAQVEVFRDQRERVPAASEPIGRDKFANAPENAFKVARDARVSTFSIDVDTASYAFVRAQLNRNVLPPAASVFSDRGADQLLSLCL